MLAGLGGRKHPHHTVLAGIEPREIGEKHLVIAQPVGGHQAKHQAPPRIGDGIHHLQNLSITGQLPKAGLVQAIARSPLIPVRWQRQLLMPGQQRQHQTALLPRAARQGIALQHLLE